MASGNSEKLPKDGGDDCLKSLMHDDDKYELKLNFVPDDLYARQYFQFHFRDHELNLNHAPSDLRLVAVSDLACLA